MSALIDDTNMPMEVAVGRAALGSNELRVVQFVIEEGHLTDAQGDALDASRLRARLSRVPELPDECGYCAMPARDPPQVMYPGDGCGVPSFASVFVDGEPTDPERMRVVREALRIVGEGACANERTEPDRRALVLRGLEPSAIDPTLWLVPDAVGLFRSGAVAFLHETFTTILDPDGASRRIDELPFRGPVVSSVSVGDDLLVASWDRSEPGYTRYDRLSLSGSFQSVALAEPLASLELRPTHLGQGPGGRVLLGGRIGRDRGAIETAHMGVASCRVEADRFADCSVPVNGWTSGEDFDGTEAQLSAMHPSGAAIGLDPAGRGGAGPFGDERRQEPISIPEDVQHEIGLVSQPRVIGDRVWLCGGAGEHGRILSATLDGSGIGRFQELVVLNSWCIGISEVDPRGRARVYFRLDAPGRALLAFEVGTGTVAVPIAAPETPDGVELIELFGLGAGAGWSLGLEESGSAYRMAPDGSFARVFGPEPRGWRQIRVLAETPDEVIAISEPPKEMISVSKRTLEATRRPLGLRPGEVAHAAVFDHLRGDLVLVGRSETRGMLVRRVSVSNPMETRLLELPPSVSTWPRDAVEPSPGRVIVVGDDWLVMEVNGDEIRALHVQWDDPSTAEVEPQPRSDEHCDGRGVESDGPKMGTWRAADARDGVAWLAGCSGVVARVAAFGSVQRAILPAELFAGRDGQASLTAIRPIGGGNAVAGAREHRFRDREIPFLVDLTSTGVGLVAEPSTRFPASLESPGLGQNSGDLIDLVGEPGQLAAVCGQGSIPRGIVDRPTSASRLLRLSSAPLSALGAADGRVFLGTRHGRLLVLDPE